MKRRGQWMDDKRVAKRLPICVGESRDDEKPGFRGASRMGGIQEIVAYFSWVDLPNRAASKSAVMSVNTPKWGRSNSTS